MKKRLDRTNGTHHVYRCYDAEGRLIYVGSTASLFQRLEQHRRTSWWASQVVQVTAKVYPTGTIAREVERRIIADDQPRWNKAGRWSGRHCWSIAQWDDWLTMLLARGDFFHEVSKFVSLYMATWGMEPNERDMKRVEALREDYRRRQEEIRKEAAERKIRWAEIEREEQAELEAWRSERVARGIPADCICTDSRLDERLFDEDCDAHPSLLEQGVL